MRLAVALELTKMMTSAGDGVGDGVLVVIDFGNEELSDLFYFKDAVVVVDATFNELVVVAAKTTVWGCGGGSM